MKPLEKNPSGFSSSSYEVTFGLGTLGINLQATRSGKGAYVDSFHRPPDNSILPAEQSGYIKLGDIVLEINGEDVSNLTLSELPKVIERAKRPVTIKFERGNLEFDFVDVVRDPRKLPWFMQFIVEKYGIEEAIHEQAKLMLWLECEQFIENDINVPDGDYSDQAYMILKKFFRPDSSFSLLLHVPEKVRSSMLTALAEAESDDNGLIQPDSPPNDPDQHGRRRGTPIPQTRQHGEGRSYKSFLQHHFYRDAQQWAEEDMKSGSFKFFCSNKMCARMTGHLRYSPPFVKISLSELLGCDKKSVFLLLYLCQARRHGILHCYELLKHHPEENIEGGVPAIEEMIRSAIACVHVLGLQDGRSGIEDLWMLNRLSELIPPIVEQNPLLLKFIQTKSSGFYNTDTYLEYLQHEISLSIPISESIRLLARSSGLIIDEIRHCIRELRTTLLRELATEIVPKFFASNEFEILLWELDAHKLYLLSQEKISNEAKTLATNSSEDCGEDDELVDSFTRMATRNLSSPIHNSNSLSQIPPTSESVGPAVPDGAVQRILRKLSATLPSTITMHRAPLDLVDTLQQEKELLTAEPLGWLLLFDTEGGKLLNPVLKSDEPPTFETQAISTEKLRVVAVTPIALEKGTSVPTTTDLDQFSVIPEGITSFLAPTGRYTNEAKTDTCDPAPVLFNFSLATRDNSLMYGCTLLLHRKESVFVSAGEQPKTKVDIDLDSLVDRLDKSSLSGSKPKQNSSLIQTPSAIHRSHRPPPHTPKSSFRPLQSTAGNSPARVQTPSAGYSEWIGQMSVGFETMKQKSPFFDRFKEGFTNIGIGAAVSTKTSLKETKDENSSSPTDLGDDSSELKVGDPVEENGEYFDESSVTGPVTQTVIVDLHVVYGFALVTRVPCINGLRSPLSVLVQDGKLFTDLHPLSQEKRGSDWASELLILASDAIEKHDSLRSLRHTYHQHQSHPSTRIPSVMRWGGAHDLDARMILNTLTPKNFVTLLIAFILEYKIAIVSSKISVLTVLGELLKSIIAPLKWSHVYVPLIPKQFNNDILQCPTPFFVGVQREFFDASSIPHDVIILDIDSDACRITSDLAKALYAGRLLAEALEKVLRPSLIFCDDISSSVDEQGSDHFMIPNVLRLCKLFIADILIGTEECCTYAVDHDELVVLFDEAMFSNYKLKRSKKDSSIFPYDKAFIGQLMRTQCFSLCVVGNILKKLDPNSRPPSRPSSPFVSIPSPFVKSVENTALPSTPVQSS